MSDGSCIFCNVAKKSLPSKIIFEDKDIVAFEDIKPQAPVHILVIPKKHIENMADLADDDIATVGTLVMAAKRIAKDKLIEDSGYRIVINCNRDAGQEVPHLHLHLLGGRRLGWPPG